MPIKQLIKLQVATAQVAIATVGPEAVVVVPQADPQKIVAAAAPQAAAQQSAIAKIQGSGN